MIEVKEVRTKKDLDDFINFPLKLYKGSERYVPAMKGDEKGFFSERTNPILRHADVVQFLAIKNGKIAGRIAAIENRLENGILFTKKLRFGWLDFIEDEEVLSALVSAASAWGKARGLGYMEGPVGFTNLDKAALLTEGFDELCATTTLYNYPYYGPMLGKLGFEKDVEWVESEIRVPEEVPEKVRKFSKIVTERYKLVCPPVKSKKELEPLIPQVFDILNKSYAVLHNFVPLTKEQESFYSRQFINAININYVNYVLDENGDMIAFGIAIPYMGAALNKAKGKLLPFGWRHLLKAQRNNDRAELLLIGVDPQWQKKGIPALIFESIMQKFIDKGVKYVESNPRQADNLSITQLLKSYEQRPTKDRWTFKKAIE